MSEIPEDVMEAAKEAYERYGGVAYNSLDLIDSIARAIMAERERCKMRTARETLDQLDKIYFPKWGSQGLIEAVEYSSAVGAIARAILEERERCAGLVRAVKHMDEFDRAALLEAIRK